MIYTAVATEVETMRVLNEGIACATGDRPIAVYSCAPRLNLKGKLGHCYGVVFEYIDAQVSHIGKQVSLYMYPWVALHTRKPDATICARTFLRHARKSAARSQGGV